MSGLPGTKLGWWLHDYKLRHLRLGRVKQHKKDDYRDFGIVGISWNVHWMTDLYLAVIIRDYLRFFIKNTPAIGNTVIDDPEFFTRPYSEEDQKKSDEYWRRWKDMVNNVADEFDELVKMIREDEQIDDQRKLQKKAFADLAEIFDELNW